MRLKRPPWFSRQRAPSKMSSPTRPSRCRGFDVVGGGVVGVVPGVATVVVTARLGARRPRREVGFGRRRRRERHLQLRLRARRDREHALVRRPVDAASTRKACDSPGARSGIARLAHAGRDQLAVDQHARDVDALDHDVRAPGRRLGRAVVAGGGCASLTTTSDPLSPPPLRAPRTIASAIAAAAPAASAHTSGPRCRAGWIVRSFAVRPGGGDSVSPGGSVVGAGCGSAERRGRGRRRRDRGARPRAAPSRARATARRRSAAAARDPCRGSAGSAGPAPRGIGRWRDGGSGTVIRWCVISSAKLPLNGSWPANIS